MRRPRYRTNSGCFWHAGRRCAMMAAICQSATFCAAAISRAFWLHRLAYRQRNARAGLSDISSPQDQYRVIRFDPPRARGVNSAFMGANLFQPVADVPARRARYWCRSFPQSQPAHAAQSCSMLARGELDTAITFDWRRISAAPRIACSALRVIKSPRR